MRRWKPRGFGGGGGGGCWGGEVENISIDVLELELRINTARQIIVRV